MAMDHQTVVPYTSSVIHIKVLLVMENSKLLTQLIPVRNFGVSLAFVLVATETEPWKAVGH